MIEVIVSLKDIATLKESLKLGDKVIYNTPVAEFSDDNKRSNKQSHKAKILKKLRNLAIIEYNAKRGSKTEKVQTAMTYKEIYFRRRGYEW